MTTEQARARELRRTGASLALIALTLGCSKSHAKLLVRGVVVEADVLRSVTGEAVKPWDSSRLPRSATPRPVTSIVVMI